MDTTLLQRDRLLTTAEAAERLGLASQTLNNWRSAGIGPAFVKVGSRTVRYRESAIGNYIDGLTEVAA